MQHKEKTRELFAKVAEKDGSHDRAGWLGLIELERLSSIHGVPSGMLADDFPLDPPQCLQRLPACWIY